MERVVSGLLYRAGKIICGAVFILLCRIEIRGREHIPRRGPAIFAANHTSFLDPPLVGYAVPRPLRYFARSAVFNNPVFARLVKGLGAVPVESEGFAIAVRRFLDVLDVGGAVLIFPEGTRSPDGRLRAGKAGVGLLASRAGCPVIPVAITGAARALPRRGRMIRPAKVTVTFGPPMSFGPGEPYEEISRRVMAAVRDLGAP